MGYTGAEQGITGQWGREIMLREQIYELITPLGALVCDTKLGWVFVKPDGEEYKLKTFEQVEKACSYLGGIK